MLHVVIPKGRLNAGVLALLSKAGYQVSFPSERALISNPIEGIQFQLVKARAIAKLVHHGAMDAGFIGLDLLTEAGYPDVGDVLDLHDRPVTVMMAVPKRMRDLLQAPPARPLVIATEYPEIASRWATSKNLAHIVHNTYGSTEGYADRIADIVIDCVETGDTMSDNGLVCIESLFTSTTRLITRSDAPHPASALNTFVARISQALQMEAS